MLHPPQSFTPESREDAHYFLPSIATHNLNLGTLQVNTNATVRKDPPLTLTPEKRDAKEYFTPALPISSKNVQPPVLDIVDASSEAKPNTTGSLTPVMQNSSYFIPDLASMTIPPVIAVPLERNEKDADEVNHDVAVITVPPTEFSSFTPEFTSKNERFVQSLGEIANPPALDLDNHDDEDANSLLKQHEEKSLTPLSRKRHTFKNEEVNTAILKP